MEVKGEGGRGGIFLLGEGKDFVAEYDGYSMIQRFSDIIAKKGWEVEEN